MYLQGFIHPRWCRISSINSILCDSFFLLVSGLWRWSQLVWMNYFCEIKPPKSRLVRESSQWKGMMLGIIFDRIRFKVDKAKTLWHSNLNLIGTLALTMHFDARYPSVIPPSSCDTFDFCERSMNAEHKIMSTCIDSRCLMKNACLSKKHLHEYACAHFILHVLSCKLHL